MKEFGQAYVRGYLAGQATAYCEMISRGVRLAGQLTLPKEYLEDLVALVKREGCEVLACPVNDERVTLWIYMEPAVRELIDDLQSVPASRLGVWGMGKLFGYADCEVINFLKGSSSSASTEEPSSRPCSDTEKKRCVP